MAASTYPVRPLRARTPPVDPSPAGSEDNVADLLAAFDPAGTLSADLREIWQIIRDGVPAEVRTFWMSFAGNATAYDLPADQIEALIARDIRYTERKFAGPFDQELVDKMTRRGRASRKARTTEIDFTARLLRSHHARHERLCTALAGDPARLTRLTHALYTLYAIENSALLNGAALQRAEREAAAAREQRGKLDAINQSQCWVEMDLDGRVLTANEVFLRAMGYDLAGIVGQPHRIFCAPDYARSTDYAAFWAKLRAGEFVQGECERLSRSGDPVFLQATYSPVLDGDGRPLKIVKCATDVTAMRLAERTESANARHFRLEADRRRIAHEATLSALSTIVDDIGTVTRQTAMLALNASIEAARAGELGNSFGVVAGEVKGLSGRIREATSRASALLSEGQQAITAASG